MEYDNNDIIDMIKYWEFLSTVSKEAKEDQVKFLEMDYNSKLEFIKTAVEEDKIYKYNDFCPISKITIKCGFAFRTFFGS